MINNNSFAAALIASSLLIGGCATYDYQKPSPTQSLQIGVQVTDEKYDGINDVPLGVYKVPDSSIIVSGHQKGAGSAGMFGVLGVLAAGSRDASLAKDNVSQSSLKGIPLKSMAENAFVKTIASQGLKAKFKVAKQNGPRLQITPAILMNYISDTEISPFIVLKARLSNTDGSKIWSMRVFVASDKSRPLSGKSSWAENGGQALSNFAAKGLKQAANILLKDMAKPYVRDEKNKVLVEGHVPFLRSKARLVGYKLTEDDKILVYVPKAADANIFAGINVLEKSAITFRKATDSDPVAVIIE